MEIPLFPLRTVLCPGIALPLHIFEPRYKLMVERCLEEGSPFGTVLIREGREVGASELAVAAVGSIATIREAGRYDDGRYDLLVVGTGRFAIEAIDTDREPYLVATITELDDEMGDEDRSAALADRSMRRFVTYLRLLKPRAGETGEDLDVRVEIDTPDEPDEPSLRSADAPESAAASGETEIEPGSIRRQLSIPEDPTVLSYLLSGIIQVELPRRQALLEADTTEERLELLDRILDRELWLLRRRLRLFNPLGATAQRRS
jgi:Lon protease-like protein